MKTTEMKEAIENVARSTGMPVEDVAAIFAIIDNLSIPKIVELHKLNEVINTLPSGKKAKYIINKWNNAKWKSKK